MLKKIAAVFGVAGLIAVGVLSAGEEDRHNNLRRRLQDWGSSGGGGSFGGGGGFGEGGGFGGGGNGGFTDTSSGFGGPPPQRGGGFGGPPPQGGGGFGGPPPQGGDGGFGGPPPGGGRGGFGPPPGGGGRGGPPPGGGGFGGPPPGGGGRGGPPPQGGGRGGFGGPPPGGMGSGPGPMGGGPGQMGGMNMRGGQGADGPGADGPGGGAPAPAPASLGSCENARQVSEQSVVPVWAASFPGSGSKLLVSSIEQLTGITGTDDNDGFGRLQKGMASAVKTHFPSKHVSPKFFVMDTSKIKSAILILRNPLDVMPSYFKFLWKFDDKHDPTVDPPIDRWVAWRNENYMEQITKWAEHTDWWMKNYEEDGKLLVIPFEKLVKENQGAEMLKSIGGFLSNVDPMLSNQLAPVESIGCVWENAVASKAPKKKKKGDDPVSYPFTIEQLENTLTILKNLKKDHHALPEMNEALGSYIKVVTAAKRKVEKLLGA